MCLAHKILRFRYILNNSKEKRNIVMIYRRKQVRHMPIQWQKYT